MGLASLSYREYLQRRRIYSSACENAAVNASDSLEFNYNILYSFPSNDQLMKIFLYNFEKNRTIFVNEMNSLQGLQGLTSVYKGFRGLRGFIGVYKGLQGFTRDYKGLQGYTRVHKGI